MKSKLRQVFYRQLAKLGVWVPVEKAMPEADTLVLVLTTESASGTLQPPAVGWVYKSTNKWNIRGEVVLWRSLPKGSYRKYVRK